jgi:hypothetical protein
MGASKGLGVKNKNNVVTHYVSENTGTYGFSRQKA